MDRCAAASFKVMNTSKFRNLDSAFDKVAVFGFFRQLSVLGVEEQLVREPMAGIEEQLVREPMAGRVTVGQRA